MIEINRRGMTRTVFMIGLYAIKTPTLRYGWRNFLQGVLANLQETTFAKTKWPELCPIVFAGPLGLFNVMRRARPLNSREWTAMVESFNAGEVRDPIPGWYDPTGQRLIPAERKPCSFGVWNSLIVAVDYGN